MVPLSAVTCHAASAPVAREHNVRRATEAMLGSASPRNPSDTTDSRSSRLDILLGMARQSQRQLLLLDALPVITDANQFLAAINNVDLHGMRTRIEAVFNQLFHDRRRTLNHFTGGDLVD